MDYGVKKYLKIDNTFGISAPRLPWLRVVVVFTCQRTMSDRALVDDEIYRLLGSMLVLCCHVLRMLLKPNIIYIHFFYQNDRYFNFLSSTIHLWLI